MSNQYDNNNTGVLFNNNRRTNPNQPSFRGDATIVVPEGMKPGDTFELRISAWVKKSKTGQEFVSLAFTPKDENAGAKGGGAFSSLNSGATGTNHAPAPAPATNGGVPDLNDEVPF